MTPAEKCKSPCDDHKAVFCIVCGFYVFVLAILIGYVVANDNKAMAADTKISNDLASAKVDAQKEHAEMMERIMSKITDNNQLVIQRLSRIEALIK